MLVQDCPRYQCSLTVEDGNGNRQPSLSDAGMQTTPVKDEKLPNAAEDSYFESASCASDQDSYCEDSGAEVPLGVCGVSWVNHDNDIDEVPSDSDSDSEDFDDSSFDVATPVTLKRDCEVGPSGNDKMDNLSSDGYGGDDDDDGSDDEDQETEVDCVLFSSSLRSNSGNIRSHRPDAHNPPCSSRQGSVLPSPEYGGLENEATSADHNTRGSENQPEIMGPNLDWLGDGVPINAEGQADESCEETMSRDDSDVEDHLEGEQSGENQADEREGADDTHEDVFALEDDMTTTTTDSDFLAEVVDESPRPINIGLLDYYEDIAQNTHANEDSVRELEEEKERARLEMERWFPGFSPERLTEHRNRDLPSDSTCERRTPTFKSFDPEAIHRRICDYLSIDQMHKDEQDAFYALLNALQDLELIDYEDDPISFGEEGDAPGRAWPSTMTERRISIRRFLRYWFLCCPRTCSVRKLERKTGRSVPGILNISMETLRTAKWKRPPKISVPDNPIAAEGFDIQGIPWEKKLGVSRRDARGLRDMFYQAFHNEPFKPFEVRRLCELLSPGEVAFTNKKMQDATILPSNESVFRPKALYTKYKASIGHLQLRNMMSVVGSGVVQYADSYGVKSVIPFYGDEQNAILLNNVPNEHRSPFRPRIRISTMGSKYGITLFGGSNGEWGYRRNHGEHSSTTTGIIDANPLISHVNIHVPRTSDTPHALMAGNSPRLHELDCFTGQVVASHETAFGINCTALSPTGTSCLIAGDNTTPYILDTSTMKPVHGLSGHRDYVFGCDFSPDGYHVATAAQDLTVAVWDIRTMRIIKRIACDVSNCYSVQFSPPSRGKRSLMLAEAGDRVSFVDVSKGLYDSRQVIDFFGEIAGCGFSDDGEKVWVANADPDFGGLMEFERVDENQGLDHYSFHSY